VIDKSGWDDGPWKDEPDLVYWQEEGLDCLIFRHADLGSLNGYVAVPEGHPAFGLESVDVLDGHAGITYQSDHPPGDRHPLLGETIGELFDGRRLWFFGFDCGHASDVQPGQTHIQTGNPELDAEIRAVMVKLQESRARYLNAGYRDVAYVSAIVREMALTLARIGRGQHGRVFPHAGIN
jgi:hypothetical protein